MNKIIKKIGGIVFVLALVSSCEKADLGADGPIRLRFTVVNQAYGASETITRSEKKMEAETVVIPVNEDYSMYATLEEDEGSVLRAAPGVNTRLRIIAYSDDGVNNYTYVQDAIYKVTSTSGDIEPIGTGLSVPSTGDYRFVAYAYNNSTSSWNDPPFSSSSATAAVSPSSDLLWGCDDETIVAGANNISIEMRHLFSQVVIKIASAEIIELVNVIVENSYDGVLTIASGELNKGNLDQYGYFFFPESASSVISDPRCVYTDNESPTVVTFKGYTEVGGISYLYMPPIEFNRQLEQGSSYTLRINFSKNLVWAGSNIYWKWNDVSEHSAGGYMTFDAPSTDVTNQYQRRQGLWFMWGSLVGISGMLANTAYTQYNASHIPTVYVPKYDDGTDTWEWEDPDTYQYSTQTSIPRMIPPSFPTGDRYSTYLSDAAQNGEQNWKDRRGDICRFLSANGYSPAGNYRMPTAQEFGSHDSYLIDDETNDWALIGTMGVATTVSNDDGTDILPSAFTNQGIVFPLSGSLGIYFNSPSMMADAYLSASAGSDRLFGFSLSTATKITISRWGGDSSNAYPVRCVKTN
jgi:hypothetical protein